jgi:hypothetical protein
MYQLKERQKNPKLKIKQFSPRGVKSIGSSISPWRAGQLLYREF